MAEISDCDFVASVELVVFGADRTVVVEVVKSPFIFLLVVVVHPSGSFGVATVSKFSLYGKTVI